MNKNNHVRAAYKHSANANASSRPVTYSNIEDHAIQCSECNEVVIAEYNLETREITVFDYDPYIAKPQQRKVLHPHSAGPIMRRRVTSRISVEKRLLHSFDENDFRIMSTTTATANRKRVRGARGVQ